jgi:hypothetical protein
MRRRHGLSEGVEGGVAGDMVSLASGSVVVGLAFVYGGPFVTAFMIIASIVYTTSLAFRFLVPKSWQKDLKEW